MDRLDTYEAKPRDMQNYLSAYGWHFSKAMCEWAVSCMRDKNDKPITMPSKKDLSAQLPDGVTSEGYDAVYIYAMCKADYLGNSLKDEAQIIKFVADYFSDPDGYPEKAFTRFYADCVATGKPIIWTDML